MAHLGRVALVPVTGLVSPSRHGAVSFRHEAWTVRLTCTAYRYYVSVRVPARDETSGVRGRPRHHLLLYSSSETEAMLYAEDCRCGNRHSFVVRLLDSRALFPSACHATVIDSPAEFWSCCAWGVGGFSCAMVMAPALYEHLASGIAKDHVESLPYIRGAT